MRKDTNFIIIHCAATPPGMDIGRAEIDRWHRAKGWFGIGYHFVIRRDGRVEAGRSLLVAGAHAKGYNHNSVGICMVGGLNSEGKPAPEFTAAQWEALDTLVNRMQATFPEALVIGHNEVAAKACPSFNVQQWQATRVAQ